jgi:uncharacterized BrkB/YihY/UPF0761 family membrane protein
MLVQSKIATCIEGFQYYFAQMFIIVQWSVARKIQVRATKIKIKYMGQTSNRNMNKVYRDHLFIIYWGIITQMVLIMTTYVTLVSYINICKVKVTEDNEISRFCPEHIFFTFEVIVMKHHINAHFYKKLWRAHEPGI